MCTSFVLYFFILRGIFSFGFLCLIFVCVCLSLSVCLSVHLSTVFVCLALIWCTNWIQSALVLFDTYTHRHLLLLQMSILFLISLLSFFLTSNEENPKSGLRVSILSNVCLLCGGVEQGVMCVWSLQKLRPAIQTADEKVTTPLPCWMSWEFMILGKRVT